MSKTRTRRMVGQLPSNVLAAYDKVIHHQLSKNYIEPVYVDDVNKGHYLPHRAVKCPESASSPIRIVYDCSAKLGNDFLSLNSCLDTGPLLLNDLTAILMRFRANPVALFSDIEKAFLQIRLAEDDKQYTKFLWLFDPTDINSPFVTYQFTSVLFGAMCSPFILNAAIKTLMNNHNNNDSASVRDLQHNIYVDDVVTVVI
ncbi:uncharacterized protein LOC102802412 [Saccoglossus kowalevskii]|uniref:Uncharacterized protein LOC102802412 n=1 Tax=Saccoglossus kowalevskii TaxID=10224 RepID=A0ABM0M0N5_SACKO|nr:PREDICTED: uncharacterized protein LOC102802412 [Saccoglossus kowalevskii]